MGPVFRRPHREFLEEYSDGKIPCKWRKHCLVDIKVKEKMAQVLKEVR